MENKSHAFAAGLFTLGLLSLILAAVLWFQRDRTVRLPYDLVASGSVNGLSQNASVRYRGLPVGRVVRIGLDPDGSGRIVIRMMVDENTPITTTTTATLGIRGVTGMAFIQLDDKLNGQSGAPLPSSKDHVARLPLREGLFQELQKRGEALITQLESIARSTQALLADDNRQQLVATAVSVQHAADNIADLTMRLKPSVDRMPTTLQHADQALTSASVLLGNLNRDDGPLVRNLDRIGLTAARADNTLTDLQQTVGELSRRVSNDTLPRFNALSDDLRVAARSVRGAADMLDSNPRSLLFGRPPATPGPGEPGFQWPRIQGTP